MFSSHRNEGQETDCETGWHVSEEIRDALSNSPYADETNKLSGSTSGLTPIPECW